MYERARYGNVYSRPNLSSEVKLALSRGLHITKFQNQWHSISFSTLCIALPIKCGKAVLMSAFCSNGPFSAKDIDNLCGIVYIVTIDRKITGRYTYG